MKLEPMTKLDKTNTAWQEKLDKRKMRKRDYDAMSENCNVIVIFHSSYLCPIWSNLKLYKSLTQLLYCCFE